MLNRIIKEGFVIKDNTKALLKVLDGNFALVTTGFEYLGNNERFWLFIVYHYNYSFLVEAEDFCKVRRIGEKLSETFISIGIQKGQSHWIYLFNSHQTFFKDRHIETFWTMELWHFIRRESLPLFEKNGLAIQKEIATRFNK